MIVKAVFASPAFVFVTHNVHKAVHLGNRALRTSFPIRCVKNQYSIRPLRLWLRRCWCAPSGVSRLPRRNALGRKRLCGKGPVGVNQHDTGHGKQQ